MSLKKDIIKDILSIIAYGPPSARAPAANLLFYYWPQLNPSLSDRRGIHYKYSGSIAYTYIGLFECMNVFFPGNR